LSATVVEPFAPQPVSVRDEKRSPDFASVERLVPAGAALAALVTGLARPANTDVSWLLTVNDRILAGATPYKDIIELNPPASILIYRIPALIAHWLSIRAEIAVVGCLALLIGGVLAYARGMLSRYQLGAAGSNIAFLLAAAFVLAVLPLDEMAQREHFATIFALPYALIAIARLSGKRVSLVDGLIAGGLMGLCVAIKPHLALSALLVCAYAGWRSRKVEALFQIENLALLVVALAYLVVSLAFFPNFFSNVLPMVADLYLPIRLGAAELIAHVALPIIPAVIVCWIVLRRRQSPEMLVFLLMAAGFLIAYFIQGKGWSYHAYPVIAFCLFSASWGLQQERAETSQRRRGFDVLLLAAALILPAPDFLRRDEQHVALAAAITKLAPSPRIIALSFRQSLGHPLARKVGSWVGRSWGLWPTGLALLMKERVGDDPILRAKAEGYFESDRLAFAQDIATQRPDIVLIEETPGFDFDAWIAGSKPLQAAMTPYKLVETIDNVEILQRRQSPAG